MKWKKVFIEEKAWKEEAQMTLESLSRKRNQGPMYTTQLFKFDGATATLVIGALILGVLIASLF